MCRTALCGAFLSAMANLSATLQRQSAGLPGPKLELAVDAGTWMACPQPGPKCFHLPFRGKTKSVAQHVIDVADSVQLMDYAQASHRRQIHSDAAQYVSFIVTFFNSKMRAG